MSYIKMEVRELISWAFILYNGIMFKRRFITESKYLVVYKYVNYFLTRDLAYIKVPYYIDKM